MIIHVYMVVNFSTILTQEYFLDDLDKDLPKRSERNHHRTDGPAIAFYDQDLNLKEHWWVNNCNLHFDKELTACWRDWTEEDKALFAMQLVNR